MNQKQKLLDDVEYVSEAYDYSSQYIEQPVVPLTPAQQRNGIIRYGTLAKFINVLNRTHKRLIECHDLIGYKKCPELDENGKSHYSVPMFKHCRLNYCIRCSSEKRAVLINRLIKEVSQWPNIIDLTLTIEGHHPATYQNKKRFDSMVNRFFKYKQIKARFKGQIIALELKPKGDGLYYWHYHSLIKGYPIDIRTLSRHWKKATGSETNYRLLPRQVKKSRSSISKIIQYDLKTEQLLGLTEKGEDMVAHATKYAFKTSAGLSFADYVIAFHNTRPVRVSNQFLFLLVQQGHNSSMICPKCGAELVVYRIENDTDENIGGSPPPDLLSQQTEPQNHNIPLQITLQNNKALPSSIAKRMYAIEKSVNIYLNSDEVEKVKQV
jgi:hypothetical protein